MPNFAHYFNSNFSGCKLLAHARDVHRDRDVKIYLIPGEMECVGVTDTVDKWIAPVAAEPFSLPLGQLLKDLFDGKPLTLPIMAPSTVKRPRRVLLAPGDGDTPPTPPEGPRRRATLIDDSQPKRKQLKD